MKRTVTFLLILTLVLALPATALAGINILINDNEYTFDPPPMIQEGRTLVPCIPAKCNDEKGRNALFHKIY